MLVGAVLGIIAAMITIAFNVPLNNHLDTVDPVGLALADAAREWQVDPPRGPHGIMSAPPPASVAAVLCFRRSVR